MSSYCLKCRKNTESKNPKVVRTINGRIKLLSKCLIVKNGNFLKNKKLKDYKEFDGIKSTISKWFTYIWCCILKV